MKHKIENHYAVEELYHDQDGFWAVLKDGFNYFGCCAIREDSLSRLWQSLQQVKVGDPY